jgi:ferredoxin
MAAIPENPHVTKSSECIECLDCVPICPKKAESFRLLPKPESHPETKLDLSKRRLLQGAGLGLAFAAMGKIDPGRKHPQQAPGIKISSETLIRPPGSLPEDEFVNRCVRCGTCMKACPTGGLQPAIHEAGIEGFWTPVLVPRIGCCTQECNACGQVCPTTAIRSFEIEEKKSIAIGRAMVDKSRCLAWSGGRKCLVCREYCSYHAIDVQEARGVGCPVIDAEKCVGCGACENACPIQPVAAIRVTSIGDRRSGGSENHPMG